MFLHKSQANFHFLEFLFRIHGNYFNIRHTKYVIKTAIPVSVTMTLSRPSFKHFKEVPAFLIIFSFPFRHYHKMHN